MFEMQFLAELENQGIDLNRFHPASTIPQRPGRLGPKRFLRGLRNPLVLLATQDNGRL